MKVKKESIRKRERHSSQLCCLQLTELGSAGCTTVYKADPTSVTSINYFYYLLYKRAIELKN